MASTIYNVHHRNRKTVSGHTAKESVQRNFKNSRASNSPVEAPLGAVPLATVPSIRYTSASTVGFPLESRISLPITFSISKYMINPLSDITLNSWYITSKKLCSCNARDTRM